MSVRTIAALHAHPERIEVVRRETSGKMKG
jgi:hypothetical protein